MNNPEYPESIVGALIFNKENKIFLMKSPKWKEKYIIPGGHIELGETIKQALKREIKEETNLEIFDIEFMTYREFIFGEEFHEKKHFISLNFSCKTRDTKIILNEEGSGFVWASIDDALKLSLAKYTRNTIIKYKEKYL